MSVGKKTSWILVTGLAICLLAGSAFLMSAEKRPLIPEMGLPDGKEFMGLFDETTLYWSSKLNLAMFFPSPKYGRQAEPNSSIEPVLVIEEFQDMDAPLAIEVSEPLPVLQNGNIVFVAPLTENPTEKADTTDSGVSVEDPPVVSNAPPPFQYDIETEVLRVEGVLVPQDTTVISSSRDGKIRDIFVDNGDLFQKGDMLLAYDCQDLNAEIEAMQAAERLARLKVEKGRELFKLDIISSLEHSELEVEEKKAAADRQALAAEMEACVIRASYDGRVIKRLANPEEYTRTDRVLMEIASRNELEVEFIVPSKWLRYLNVGAPLTMRINETEQTYQAKIIRIYGEVDPVSQSIQMSARLSDYDDPLLPGMSGLVVLNASDIRQAGIRGYLEGKRQAAGYEDSQVSRHMRGLSYALRGLEDG